MLFKHKLLGRPYRSDGWSSGNYGGYTTGSDSNATTYETASYAQSQYESSNASDGSGLAERVAADRAAAEQAAAQEAARVAAAQEAARVAAAQEAARIEAARVEAERVAAEQEAARIEAERVATEQAENKALVERLGGWGPVPEGEAVADPGVLKTQDTPVAQEKTDSLASRTFNLSTLGSTTKAAPGKPGESLMANAQSKMAVVDMPEAVRQSKEQGVPLSSLIGEPNRAQLQRLQDMGLGDLEGVNPNNLSGQNVNNMLASAKTGDVIGRVGNYATNAALGMVPGGQFIGAGIRAYGAIEGGMSLEDAAKATASDLAMGWLGGKVNGAVGKALGPDGRAALGAYNQAASLASLAGYNLPGANAGSYVTGAVRGALGLPTLSGKPTGLTSADGASITSLTGGWSSSNESSGQGAAAPAPVAAPAPAPAANVVDLLTNMRSNFDGVGLGQAIRSGAAQRQKSRRA